MPAYPKKFVISWISFYDNELHMKEVYATDEDHALRLAYLELTDEGYESEWNVNIKQAAFDCDGMVGALEV
jgi:hypothetical protein